MKHLLLLALVALQFTNAYAQERRTLIKENRFGEFKFSYIEVDGKVVYDGPCSYTEKFNTKAPDGSPSIRTQNVKGAYVNGKPDGQWTWVLTGKNDNPPLSDTYYYDYNIKMIRNFKDGEYDGLYSFDADVTAKGGTYVGYTWKWVTSTHKKKIHDAFVVTNGKVNGTSGSFTCKDGAIIRYEGKDYVDGFLPEQILGDNIVRFTKEEMHDIKSYFADNPNKTDYIYKTHEKWYRLHNEYYSSNYTQFKMVETNYNYCFAMANTFVVFDYLNGNNSLNLDLEVEGFGLPDFEVDLYTIGCVETGEYETPDWETLDSEIRKHIRYEYSRYRNKVDIDDISEKFISYKYRPELIDSTIAFSVRILNEENDKRDFEEGLGKFKKCLNDTLSWLKNGYRGVEAVRIPSISIRGTVDSNLELKENPVFIKGFIAENVFKLYLQKADSISTKSQLYSCVSEFNRIRSKNIALVKQYEKDYKDLEDIIDSTYIVFRRICTKYNGVNYYGGTFWLKKASGFGFALQDIKNRFKVDRYDNNFAAEKAYYQLLSNFMLWYEANDKRAKKIKTHEELYAAAGITF